MPKFDGFLAVYEEGKDQKDEEDEELKHRLPAVAEGEVLKFKSIEPEQHFTEPPPRFNEATLVKELEANGVGRPSTYAAILSTIQEREYVKKEGGRFTPTELGEIVTDLLRRELRPHLRHPATRRGWKKSSTRSKTASSTGASRCSEFYEQLKQDLEHAERHMTDIKRMEKPTDLDLREVRQAHGHQVGHATAASSPAPAIPECTNTREIAVDCPRSKVDARGEEEYCENCGRPMVLKKGRFGQFYACSGYPDCKTTKQIGGAAEEGRRSARGEVPDMRQESGAAASAGSASSPPAATIRSASTSKQKTIGVKCPNCAEGEIVERRSRRGKTSTAATAIPIATSSPGASRFRSSARSAAILIWSRSG